MTRGLSYRSTLPRTTPDPTDMAETALDLRTSGQAAHPPSPPARRAPPPPRERARVPPSLRARREPLRRARRGDQRHAAPAPGVRGGGGPPRPQPRRRGGGDRGPPRGRARRRGELLPGRTHRVLPVHAGHAPRARGGARADLRWRRRGHRARGGARAPRLRHHPHLHPGGRPADGPPGDDGRRVRAGPGCPRHARPPGIVGRSSRRGLRVPCPRHHLHRARARRPRGNGRRTAAGPRRAGPRHHRDGGLRQVVGDRRARAPGASRVRRPPAHRDRRGGSDAAAHRRRAPRRPHPHERD